MSLEDTEQTAENSWSVEEAKLFTDTLSTGAERLGFALSEEQIAQCLRYAELLLITNRHTNLTRITAPVEMAVKHFLDSLSVLSVFPEAARGKDASAPPRLIDVGTGAGFPGLVLKIAQPELRLTLLDSLQKRLTFLESVATDLGLTKTLYVHARAEDAGRQPVHRDAYNYVVARAVASLPTLIEWCGPLVKPGGVFIAMKSGTVDEELTSAKNAAQALQLNLVKDLALELPATDSGEPQSRRLLCYRKQLYTPARYPRPSAEIKRQPL